eukprot:153657_1
MGNTTQPITPAPLNSTVIQQELSWEGCYLSCNGPKIPRWLRQPPGQLLIQCGLSAQQMEQEIDAINAKAVEYVNQLHDNTHKCGYGAVVFAISLLIAGIIVGLIINMIFVLIPAVWLAVVVAMVINSCAARRHKTIWNECLNHIRSYVQNEVAHRYHSMGLAWSIRSRNVMHGSGKNRFYMTYHDICITPPTVQQQPVVIYVDQNGNRIQPQQQVIVVNQNGVPVQNQAQMQPQTGSVPLQVQPQGEAAPPAYESEAPPTYAPQDEDDGRVTNM